MPYDHLDDISRCAALGLGCRPQVWGGGRGSSCREPVSFEEEKGKDTSTVRDDVEDWWAHLRCSAVILGIISTCAFEVKAEVGGNIKTDLGVSPATSASCRCWSSVM